MNNFFNRSVARLPNQRFRPADVNSQRTPAALDASNVPQNLIAAYLLLDGGFNVNSTSVSSWKAVLSALRGAQIETFNGLDKNEDKEVSFPRLSRPVNKNTEHLASMGSSGRYNRWEGYRSLTDEQVDSLASEIVNQVRKRGPFLSVADFVNRGVGPDTDEVNLCGAIQAALDRLNVNPLSDSDGIGLSSGQLVEHDYKSMRTATSSGANSTATNAPGAITQGDVLTGLGSRITVRSDTFRIRAYGEARDSSGKAVVARAWCEAVIQRMPEYVNPVVDPWTPQIPGTGGQTSVNQIFGRRYQLVNFRWLAAEEV